MRPFLSAAILSAATLGIIPSLARAADDAPAKPAATQQADVPVKAVVLFSSGVG